MRTILQLFLPEQLKSWGMLVGLSALSSLVCWKVLQWQLTEIYLVFAGIAYIVMLITCDGGMGRNLSWVLNLPLSRRHIALGRMALGLFSLLWFLLYVTGLGIFLLMAHYGPGFASQVANGEKLNRIVEGLARSQGAGVGLELMSLFVILSGFLVLGCTATFNNRNMQELSERVNAHWRASSPGRRVVHLSIYTVLAFVGYRFLLDATWFWVVLFAGVLSSAGILQLTKSLAPGKRELRVAYAAIALVLAAQALPLYGRALYLARAGAPDERAYAISFLGRFDLGTGQAEIATLLSAGLRPAEFADLAALYRRRYLHGAHFSAQEGEPVSFARVLAAAKNKEALEAVVAQFRGFGERELGLVLARAEAVGLQVFTPAVLAALAEVPVSEEFLQAALARPAAAPRAYALTRARYQLSEPLARVITKHLASYSERELFRAQETLSLARGAWISVPELLPLMQGRLPASLVAAAPDCAGLHFKRPACEAELAPYLQCARLRVKGADAIQQVEAYGWMELPLSYREEAYLQRLFP